MLRVLTFESYDPSATDVPHKRYFDLIWLAIMLQGNPSGQGGARGRAQVKQARRIKSEFRDCGERLTTAQAGIEGRDEITLSRAGGKVALAEDDYRKMLEWIEAVPWKGGNLDDVDDCFEFLDAAPQVKTKEIKAALDEVAAPTPTGDA